MKMSMYQASLPLFKRMLTNLAAILAKGAAYAEARKIDPEVLVNARLFPDMFPLSRQVQIASDSVKGCAARLAGQEIPKYEDNEKTFPELIARVNKTIAYIDTFKPEDIDGSEDKAITIPLRSGDLHFDGMTYLLHFALPNFYFHVTTAYNILRHCGVEVGKMDFLGKP
jgi:uncharacterized protein